MWNERTKRKKEKKKPNEEAGHCLICNQHPIWLVQTEPGILMGWRMKWGGDGWGGGGAVLATLDHLWQAFTKGVTKCQFDVGCKFSSVQLNMASTHTHMLILVIIICIASHLRSFLTVVFKRHFKTVHSAKIKLTGLYSKVEVWSCINTENIQMTSE